MAHEDTAVRSGVTVLASGDYEADALLRYQFLKHDAAHLKLNETDAAYGVDYLMTSKPSKWQGPNRRDILSVRLEQTDNECLLESI